MELQRFVRKVLLYGLLFVGLNMLLGHYLSSFETGPLTQVGGFYAGLRWGDYYQQQEEIDVLVLGSSHAFRSYHPPTLEANLAPGTRVFNSGSSAQSPLTSYYILQEVLDQHPLQLVIFDLYYLVFTSDEQLKNGLINLRSMQWGPGKKDFFLNGLSWEDQIAVLFFPSYVYQKNLKPRLKQLLGFNYIPRKVGQYQGQGYVSFPDTISMQQLQEGNQFDRFTTAMDEITPLNVEYLRKLVALCRERGVNIIFTVAPMPEISVKKIDNYRQHSAYFEELAAGLSVPYYDFNLERFPEIKDEQHFYDDDHLNTAGAAVLSKAIAPLIHQHLTQ